MYRHSLAIVTLLSHLMYDPRHKDSFSLLLEIAISPSISTFLLCPFTSMRRRSFGTIWCTYLYSNIFFTVLIIFLHFYFLLSCYYTSCSIPYRLLILPSSVGLPSTIPFAHVLYSPYGTYICRSDRCMCRRSLAIVSLAYHHLLDKRLKYYFTVWLKNGISPSISHLLLSPFTRICRQTFVTIRCMYYCSSSIFLMLINFIYLYLFLLTMLFHRPKLLRQRCV